MLNARIAVVLVAMLVPYLARLPGGMEWLAQYTNADIRGWLLLQAFNAIAWGSILAISLAYRRPAALLAPALLGFGYLAWAHYSLDLAGDAQAAVGIVFIPIYALLPIVIGGIAGYGVDRRLRK
ncbi:hypothetical protein ACVW0Y_000029 [Pseudomonas sp. TE3786]